MRKSKKVLSLLLAALMVLTMVPMVAFAEGNVAEVGGVGYATLQAAFDAVEPGVETTVKMIADEVITENAGAKLVAGKIVILDLAGKNISNDITVDGGSQVIDNRGTLTIKDSEGTGSISNLCAPDSTGNWHSTPRRNWGTYVVNNEGKLTVESGHIISTPAGGIAYAINNGMNANLDITGGNIETLGAVEVIRMFSSNGTINITGGTLSGSGVVYMQICGAPNGTLNIGGDAVLNTTTGYRIIGYEATQSNSDLSNVKINVSGGYFTKSEGATNTGYPFEVENDSGKEDYGFDYDNIVLTGGTFHMNTFHFCAGPTDKGTENLNAICAKDYKALYDGDEANTWTVRKAVAEIDGVGYETLQAAFDAVEPGVETTVKMIADEVITENAGAKLVAGKIVVLDLAGKNISNDITVDGGSQVIDNRGTLTIKDSEGTGSISNLCAPDSTGNWHSTPRRNWGTYVVNNEGKLTVESGHIISTPAGGIAYAINNGMNANLDITGGNIETLGAVEVIRMFSSNGTINITGGTLSGSGVVYMQICGAPNGTLNIGGDAVLNTTTGYRIIGYEATQSNSDLSNVKINVSGGYFTKSEGATNTGYPFEVENDSGKEDYGFDYDNIVLTGGTFHMNTFHFCAGPTDKGTENLNAICAKDYKALYDGDEANTWTVRKESSAVIVEEVKDEDIEIVDEQTSVEAQEEQSNITVVIEAKDGEGEAATPVTTDVKDIVSDILNNDAVKNFEETKIDEAVAEKIGVIKEALKGAATVEDIEDAIDAAEDESLSKYIHIDPKAVTVSQVITQSTVSTIKEMSFDVKPMVTTEIKNNEGEIIETITTIIPNEAITSPLTFRLPVDKSIEVGTIAKVFHKGEYYGSYAVKEENGDKFLELEGTEFSIYSYELQEDKVIDADDVIVAKSLTLNENIDVNFYVKIKEGTDVSDYTIARTSTATYGTTDEEPVALASISTLKSGTAIGDAFKFIADCAASPEMGETVNVKIYYKGVLIKDIDYSVKQYCINTITKEGATEKAIKLCTALLDYGTCAQIYFDENNSADEYVNKEYSIGMENISATVIPDSVNVSSTTGLTDGIKVGTSVVLTSGIRAKVYFIGIDDSYTFTLDGESVSAEKVAEGQYAVKTPGLGAGDLSKAYTFTASNGSNTITKVYSVDSYAYSKQSSTTAGLSDLVKALYLYSVAADEYFAK